MVIKLDIKRLLFFILLTEGVGVLGAIISGNIKAVYNALALPPLSPPPIVFGIVWPLLYLLIAVSAYMVSKSEDKQGIKVFAYIAYGIVLLLNLIWPILFFRFLLYKLSLLILCALLLSSFIMMYFFGKLNRNAGILLLPYILWLIFALYLNIGVAIAN